MQDVCKRLAAALCAALLGLTLSCCSAPDTAPAGPAAPEATPAAAEPSAPAFADGERTLAILHRLGEAPLCLKLSTDSETLFFSGDLTLYTDGENAACYLETDGETLETLLADGDEWVLRYADRTRYKSGDGYMASLLENLRALAGAEGYVFDCGEMIWDGSGFDYESFMDGERNVTMLFAPGTAELRLVLVDREPVEVLEISGELPDGVFSMPDGFSVIHP